MVICTLLFIAFYEFSTGPIVWLYNAEILHAQGISIANFIYWALSFAIAVSMPLLVKSINLSWVFSGFAIVCIFETFFVYWFVPETKGLTQKEIQDKFYG